MYEYEIYRIDKFDCLGLRSVEDLLLVSENELSECIIKIVNIFCNIIVTNERVDKIHSLLESVKSIYKYMLI